MCSSLSMIDLLAPATGRARYLPCGEDFGVCPTPMCTPLWRRCTARTPTHYCATPVRGARSLVVQQVGAPQPGEALGLVAPPRRDGRVVAAEQNFGHLVAAPRRRAG